MPLSNEQRRFFRDLLREARAAAHQDAENFDGIIHAIEALGAALTGKCRNGLNDYRAQLVELARRSSLAFPHSKELAEWHISAGNLFDVVRCGRNDAIHSGAQGRHLTEHAVQLAIILEDALMPNGFIKDFMIRNPLCAEPCQPVSYVRQQMLANSFSFLPVYFDSANGDPSWFLVSDIGVASYLRVHTDSRKVRVAQTIRDAVERGESGDTLELQAAVKRSCEEQVAEALTDLATKTRIILVTSADNSNSLRGIVTAFDLL